MGSNDAKACHLYLWNSRSSGKVSSAGPIGNGPAGEKPGLAACTGETWQPFILRLGRLGFTGQLVSSTQEKSFRSHTRLVQCSSVRLLRKGEVE